MRPYRQFLLPAILLIWGAASGLRADSLSFQSPNGTIWSNFYTSPYYAKDNSNNQVLMIFCLDYNHEIAPPHDWQANLNTLQPSNVSQFQFGGSYPGALATPFAFQSDSAYAGDPYAVTMQAGSDAYHRYLEAAWLFTNILAAQAKGDTGDMKISQVAAWDLFVDTVHISDLASRIAGTGGTWNFTHYIDNPNASLLNLTFRDAVDEAVNSAQSAVLGGWNPAIQWSVVTGDSNWVRTSNGGNLAQEFLTPYAPNPEPSTILLFGSGLLILLWATRRTIARRMPAKSR